MKRFRDNPNEGNSTTNGAYCVPIKSVYSRLFKDLRHAPTFHTQLTASSQEAPTYQGCFLFHGFAILQYIC